MRRLMLALAAGAALAGPPAVAQTAADAADVRCVLSLQAVAADPKQREQAVRGVYFYMGKIAARGSVGRVEGTMLNEGKALNSAQKVQTELARCGGELSRSSQALQTANQKAAATARASMGPAAAPPAKK